MSQENGFMVRTVYSVLGALKLFFIYPLAERMQNRKITPKFHILRNEASFPFNKRKKIAKKRLIESLVHAEDTVPYYKDLFKKYDFKPEKLEQDIRYFEDLPYLTKDILREQGQRMISAPYANKIVREQKTGGSTGLAATIYYTQEGLDWTAAQNILMLEWGGKRRYHRESHLSTFFSNPPPEAISFEKKKCFALNRYNIYTDGFSDTAQKKLLDDLKKARAVLVQGHPSSLFALARYLKQREKKASGLFDIFVSTGEMLTDVQRKLIEDIFSVRVSNRYGACEFGVMAQELASGPKGELLVSDSIVWPEYRPADSQNGTELVFTNLRNKAMPLIRYRMGDLGTLEERDNGWWIKNLTGRTHDSVVIDDTSYPTHYIQDILDRCGPISDFQIMVKENKAKELRIVTKAESWDLVQSAVIEYFPSLPLKRIEAEELIFVGIRGKFSYLIRETP